MNDKKNWHNKKYANLINYLFIFVLIFTFIFVFNIFNKCYMGIKSCQSLVVSN